ncbi:repressor LexA [Candidatus Nomurabacteria bacterium]|jgi:SOS regulatory protein LexA|nr:MAG: repressor LexA [Candidatus Nomurabacteria bacterium]
MQPEEKIQDFYRNKKRMPSYAEIANLFGFQSKNAAYKLVRNLIDKRILAKDKQGKLIPLALESSIRLLGLIEAGFPTPAEETLIDTISLDEFLIENREATFMLRVKGDSMYDAGIREGDMVLVERTTTAKTGAIVIAEVDGAWTMKYLRKQGMYFYLEPANKKYKPIFPKESLKIAAVVKAIIRKY